MSLSTECAAALLSFRYPSHYFYFFLLHKGVASHSIQPFPTKSDSKPAKIFEADAKLPVGILKDYGIGINMLAVLLKK